MKEIVVVRLAIDAETGAIDPAAPLVFIPRQRPYRGGVYDKEPGVIVRFLPGEREARSEASQAETIWRHRDWLAGQLQEYSAVAGGIHVTDFGGFEVLAWLG